MVNNEYRLTVLYYPSDHESWNGEKIEELFLFQVDQVQEVFLPILEQIKEMKFLQVINVINRSRKQSLVMLESKRKDYLNGIISKERDLVNYKKNVADLEAQIKTNQIKDLTKEEVVKLFDLLSKNKKVENAFINMAGEMVVETKMLYATTPVELIENKKKPIGRMVFRLSTSGIAYCSFANLDYCYHSGGITTNGGHYPHPNVSGGRICSGSNGTLLSNMCQGGQFYELVDFLLVFFSLFPHDSGGPHVQHEVWMATRKPEPKTNPFETEQRLWELYPGKKTEPPKKKEDYPEHKLDKLAGFVAGNTAGNQGLTVSQIIEQHLEAIQAITIPGAEALRPQRDAESPEEVAF